ncbi:MAG: hypothetical protein LBQ59_05520 [Candidatus Peribacteria bacterium]|nr:hypothetical protein [Candidatus Peribacteria bacterium]
MSCLLPPFPNPFLDSRFNLPGCPRMTYEDDIRGKKEKKKVKLKKN